MVLEVRADLRGVAPERDVVRAQMLGRAGAGQHEDVRRAERARAEHDAALRPVAATRAGGERGDAGGLRAVELDARHVGAGGALRGSSAGALASGTRRTR